MSQEQAVVSVNRGGRPRREFDQRIADAICERIADGESLRDICKDENMPGRAMVLKWLSRVKEFAAQYSLAREIQADLIFDEILSIADDGRNDGMERQGSKAGSAWVENGEALRRSALRIEARKWMAGRLRPKKYGDRTQMELTGQQGEDGEATAIRITIVDPER